MNKSITRSSLFWSLFIGLSIVAASFTYKYFGTAFPILSVDLKMDRELALQKAAELASTYNWSPKGYHQVAAFNSDQEAKNYIELEGGGVEKLKEIIHENYFSPYQWVVRHFKEHNEHETVIYFTPNGRPYSFVETLDEKAPGAALNAEKARDIAVERAQQDWQINFDEYTLVEESQVTQPGKRIDHTFMYEKIGVKIGEAPYRLKLAVSGDTFSELSLELKVPEGFTRRYEHMRSANNAIATGAQIVLILLYLFIGCILGLWLLMKKNYVLWNKPIFWGLFLGILQVGNAINQWPILWFGYDSALSTTSFTINFLVHLAILFGFSSSLYTIIFAAAESLTRKAFGEQPQLWQMWSSKAAPTIQVLGRTVAGYLIPSFKLLYVVSFYFITQRFFNWWSPAESLIDPNGLASYVPWFSSVSQALTAGFWEECMFRAVPLAGAALLGDKFGKRKLFIAIAFVIQALVFGAGHANYPAQPAYARVVELVLSSYMFGTLYLYFGLLPAIISHFVYDAILMSLPIFIATAPGMWINQIMVVFSTLIPLFIVLYYRYLSGRWHELATNLYNAAWIPPKVIERPVREQPSLQIATLAPRIKQFILIAGITGLCLWGLFGTFEQDTVPLTLSRTQAIEHASNYLEHNNITLEPGWSSMAFVQTTPDTQHNFVWRTGDKSLYQQLSGKYLIPPAWIVRFAQFVGDLEERAEEYRLYITNNGSLFRLEHVLPEKRTGKQLKEADARLIAQQSIAKTYQLVPTQLKEISAESKQQPNRKDWKFIFQDTAIELPQDGQARITVDIGGDTVIDQYRSVFVPEAWERENRQKATIYRIIGIICTLLFSLLLLIAFYMGFAQHYGIAWGTAAIFATLLLLKSSIQLINLWPTIIAHFTTSQPYVNQIWMTLVSMLITILATLGLVGLLAGFTKRWHFSLSTKFSCAERILFGTNIAVALFGILAVLKKLSPQVQPLWADYTGLGAFNAPLNIAFTAFTNFIISTSIALLIVCCIDTISKGWHKNKVYSIIGFILFGTITSGMAIAKTENIIGWLSIGPVEGLLLCLLFVFVLRFDRAIIPLICGSVTLLATIQNGILMAHPAALLGGILTAITIGVFSCWWSQLLSQD